MAAKRRRRKGMGCRDESKMEEEEKVEEDNKQMEEDDDGMGVIPPEKVETWAMECGVSGRFSQFRAVVSKLFMTKHTDSLTFNEIAKGARCEIM